MESSLYMCSITSSGNCRDYPPDNIGIPLNNCSLVTSENCRCRPWLDQLAAAEPDFVITVIQRVGSRIPQVFPRKRSGAAHP